MTISKHSTQIWKTLLPAGTDLPVCKLAILGVGNEFNGDDAAGVQFARIIQNHLKNRRNLLILDCGLAPQNFTSPLRKFEPDKIILVDAADMGLEPGQLAILQPEQIDGLSCSTHTFPLSMIAKYMEQENNCPVHLLGIQIASVEPFSPISDAVTHAVQQLSEDFLQYLTDQPA